MTGARSPGDVCLMLAVRTQSDRELKASAHNNSSVDDDKNTERARVFCCCCSLCPSTEKSELADFYEDENILRGRNKNSGGEELSVRQAGCCFHRGCFVSTAC